ncbi:hypothetical protein JCM8208_005542 [Rhodotorula glutinis]
MPSAASKAANARYFDELKRGAIHALAPELPIPPPQFHPPRPPPPVEGSSLPRRRRGPGPAKVQSCEACRISKRAQTRGIQCEYIAAGPLRAAIADSVRFASNRIEITRLRAQVALLLRVLRISDAELQHLMHRADQPEPFVLPSPWRPVRWAAPPRRSSALVAVDEEELPEPVIDQHESAEEEGQAEEGAVEEERVEAEEAVSKGTVSPPPPREADAEPEQVEPEGEKEVEVEVEKEKEATPTPPPPRPSSKRKREREPEPAPEPSRRRSQRFMPKVEEVEPEELKPRRRSSRLKRA